MKKTMMKRLCVVLCVGLCMSGLFAGGAAEKKEVGEKQTTIRLVHYMGEQSKRNALDEMIQIYQKNNPNVKIDIETVASSSYLATYKNYIAAGDAPDIMFGKPQNMAEFVSAGYFKDIKGAACLENVLPMLLDECTIDGGVYGFPIDAQVKATFYNKKMYRDAGLSVPQTKDEFFAVCDAFMSKGTYPLIHPFNFIHGVYHELDSYFTSMAAATGNGNVWMDSQKGVAPLSGNPVVHEGFEMFSKLVSYKDAGDPAVDQTQGIQDFAAGKRPMYINGGWLIGDVLAAAPNGEFGMFPTPWSNNAEENKMWIGIDDVFIVSETTKHEKEVMDLLTSFASAESSAIWMNTAKLMSSNVTVSTDGASELIQAIKSNIDQEKIVSKSEVLDYTSEFSTAFRTKLQYFVTLDDAKRNVTALLKDIDREIESIRY